MARANPLSNGTAVLIGVAAAAAGGALGWYLRNRSLTATTATSATTAGKVAGVGACAGSVAAMVNQAAASVNNPALQQPPSMNPAFLGAPMLAGPFMPNLPDLHAAVRAARAPNGCLTGLGALPPHLAWGYLRDDRAGN